jgi:hypothetical protein
MKDVTIQVHAENNGTIDGNMMAIDGNIWHYLP